HLHQAGLGVILDWVGAHFPTDDHSLHRFDGTALYEHVDPRKGVHPHWNTAIFNWGRKEVSNFLIASALFWLDVAHIDGLRVDAVASMLYLDYGRKEGEWIPNPDGSQYNLEAIEFIKHMNSIVHKRFPKTWMIAEESSSYAQVTSPDGLGFDLKWNMGWMNDTLRYFNKDPYYRKFHQNDLTFSLLYAFSERFLLPLSHDEVVHGKRSLLSKMPGPDWQKMAQLRLLYSYMMGHPGKKLFFMGGEIGQWQEWDCKSCINWDLLQWAPHLGIQTMVKEINRFYLDHAELWEADHSWEGYEWVDFHDSERCVISYLRQKRLLFVHHFTPEYCPNYAISLTNVKEIREVFNTDSERYGGSGKVNSIIQWHPDHIVIELAPLATQIFEVVYA
ncbi:MAG: 1,4-alpha-glucan-branching enzyme, partial [Chlamydiota bacterium]